MMNEECNSWAHDDPLMLDYHDTRWCRPVHDDNELFAMLCLEGQQAGLSWSTIVKKEAAFRLAFDNYDISRVAHYDEHTIEKLMNNTAIVRNRRKIESAIHNARVIEDMLTMGKYSTFDEYMWHFTDGARIVNRWTEFSQIPAKSKLSEAVSKDMKKYGFTFVGPVIMYSYLQGIGVIDDHLDGCPCKLNEKFSRK
ncbi:DNA-3-methyladenine glycosylase I [Alloscardovia venturai]|uniref:DNA-3-methyladenine glycosylase I n=1 Tax=Alloscardovia venturai TaxID=1769421 RepID=A0ABW2Y677_9BIFI